MYSANSEKRVKGGDYARRRKVCRALKVDAEHQDVARLPTKTVVVSDAEAIDVGVDCDVLLVEEQRQAVRGETRCT